MEESVNGTTAVLVPEALWFSTTTASPAVMVAMPAPAEWQNPTVLGSRSYLMFRTAVVPRGVRPTYPPADAPAVEEIEVMPHLGMNFGEAVRRGRLLAERVGDAADIDVGD